MQIIYVELNLASDFDTSGGCHFFFNYYQQWGNLLYIRISLTTRENTLVARDGEGFIWGSPFWLVGARVGGSVLMFWGLLAQPAGRSDWPAENYPVRTHIATPESITPFCYISPDWTNPCFLRIAQCNTSCDWMALVIFICVRHLAGISPGNFRQKIVDSEADRTWPVPSGMALFFFSF